MNNIDNKATPVEGILATHDATLIGQQNLTIAKLEASNIELQKEVKRLKNLNAELQHQKEGSEKSGKRSINITDKQDKSNI